MKTTEEVLTEMFTENTGRHMLDSGGAYGRNWERNQSAVAAEGAEVFKTRPDVRFHTWKGKFDYVSINTFNWLLNVVEYAPDIQEKFDTFSEGSDDPWLVDMEEFVRRNQDTAPEVVNTYNYDTNLDETLQWVEWSDEYGDKFALIQYHGGADMRGGYTKPRAFRVEADYFGDDAFEVWCDNFGRETDLEGVGTAVCGLQGTFYAGSGVEWYSTRYETEVDVDMDELVSPEEGVVQCPSCKTGKLTGGLRGW